MKKANLFLSIRYLLIAGALGFQVNSRAIEGESGLPKTEIQTATPGAEHEDIPALVSVEEEERTEQAGQEPTTSSTESAPETTVLTQKQEPKPTEVTLEEESEKIAEKGKKQATGKISIVISSAAQGVRSGIGALITRAQASINALLSLLVRLITPNTSRIIDSPGAEWVYPTLSFESAAPAEGEAGTEISASSVNTDAAKGNQQPEATSGQQLLTPTPEMVKRNADKLREFADDIRTLLYHFDYEASSPNSKYLDQKAADLDRSALTLAAGKLAEQAKNFLMLPTTVFSEEDKVQLRSRLDSLFADSSQIAEKLLDPRVSTEEKNKALAPYQLYRTAIGAEK